jgi:hypothetical protein
LEKLEKYSESSSSVAERNALRKIVLLRWGVGAVGAGIVQSGAVGGARFGVLRLGEGRVPSRDYEGRGQVSVAGKRGSIPKSPGLHAQVACYKVINGLID